jgi:glycosyltransferase involved in cell wall biosynthesis
VAVTRRPDLVPAGVEPVRLETPLQELRMAWTLPRLLRRLRPELTHFQHALPLGFGGRSVVTIHDLSFETGDGGMGPIDRLVFRAVVPRAARSASHVIAVSERTRDDVVRRYGVPAERVTAIPHGVDSVFAPGPGDEPGTFVLFVGAVHARKDPLAAADAAAEAGLPLVVAGPEKDAALASALRARGAELRGYVGTEELARLYRGAAALVLPSRHEGFGLPVLEAMASGTPVVISDDPALREVAGDAAAASVRDAIDNRQRLAAAGIARARLFSWDETARRTVEVYRRVLAE